MGMLLAYELEKGTERELKSLAAALGHQVKMVSSSNYGEPLGYVAGITGFKKTNAKDTGEKIGSGTVGVVLAKRLGYRFLDSDLVIQEQTKKLLHELITEHGVVLLTFSLS